SADSLSADGRSARMWELSTFRFSGVSSRIGVSSVWSEANVQTPSALLSLNSRRPAIADSCRIRNLVDPAIGWLIEEEMSNSASARDGAFAASQYPSVWATRCGLSSGTAETVSALIPGPAVKPGPAAPSEPRTPLRLTDARLCA